MAPPMGSRRYSSRQHGSSRHSGSRRKLRAYKIAVGALAGLLVASVVLSVVLFFRMQQFRSESLRLDVALQRTEGELTKSREDITEMNNDLRILLANRIPGISELAFDRQIELNDRYVKNITFVQSGVGEEASIEFSAVLQNARSGPILPQVDVVLFDEAGLQTGIVQLDKAQTVSPVEVAELKPGESRTYSAQIPMNRDAPSKYFVVDVN